MVNDQRHQDHKQWISELNFYEDELNIFEKELNILIEKHPDLLSIVEHVDEYKEIFEKKNNHLRVLRDQIHIQERTLNPFARHNGELPWDSNLIRERMDDFVRRMEDLKLNFKRFVAKNMH